MNILKHQLEKRQKVCRTRIRIICEQFGYAPLKAPSRRRKKNYKNYERKYNRNNAYETYKKYKKKKEEDQKQYNFIRRKLIKKPVLQMWKSRSL